MIGMISPSQCQSCFSDVSPPPVQYVLLLLSPFFFWGTAMVALKGVVPHTTPFFMAAIRLLPAGGLILVAAALSGRPQPRGLKAWSWIALFAIVDGTLFQGFLALGLQDTGAGLGSVLIDSQPLLVALLSAWFFGEYIGLWGGLGLLLGLIGISAIGLPRTLADGPLNPRFDPKLTHLIGYDGSESVLGRRHDALSLPSHGPGNRHDAESLSARRSRCSDGLARHFRGNSPIRTILGLGNSTLARLDPFRLGSPSLCYRLWHGDRLRVIL